MIFRRYIIPFLVGIAMFVAVHIVDAAMARAGLHAEATYGDDILLGVLAGVLASILQLQHERELLRQRRYAEVIGQMNHHIRNALQVIVYSMDPKARDNEELQDIRDSVDRIDWALREILPAMKGNTGASSAPPKNPS